MADVRLPRYVGECPQCGEPLEVVKQRSTAMPGEVVIDFTPRCSGGCEYGNSATPWPYGRLRPDGWPFCPRCDEDELWSNTVPARVTSIVGCYRCGWRPDGRVRATEGDS